MCDYWGLRVRLWEMILLGQMTASEVWEKKYGTKWGNNVILSGLLA